MSLPYAVIIAGGRGERLGGVRKGDLRIGNRPLADRVIDALGNVQAPIMWSSGSGNGAPFRGGGVLEVPDIQGSVGGPLAGLVAAVAALQKREITTGLLVSAAVDTPFLPPDFAAEMQAALGDASAAYGAFGDDFYPPNALWRLEALGALPNRVREGQSPGSLKALLHELDAAKVDWTGRFATNPFANVNTVADLLALERLDRDK